MGGSPVGPIGFRAHSHTGIPGVKLYLVDVDVDVDVQFEHCSQGGEVLPGKTFRLVWQGWFGKSAKQC